MKIIISSLTSTVLTSSERSFHRWDPCQYFSRQFRSFPNEAKSKILHLPTFLERGRPFKAYLKLSCTYLIFMSIQVTEITPTSKRYTKTKDDSNPSRLLDSLMVWNNLLYKTNSLQTSVLTKYLQYKVVQSMNIIYSLRVNEERKILSK